MPVVSGPFLSRAARAVFKLSVGGERGSLARLRPRPSPLSTLGKMGEEAEDGSKGRMFAFVAAGTQVV